MVTSLEAAAVSWQKIPLVPQKVKSVVIKHNAENFRNSSFFHRFQKKTPFQSVTHSRLKCLQRNTVAAATCMSNGSYGEAGSCSREHGENTPRAAPSEIP